MNNRFKLFIAVNLSALFILITIPGLGQAFTQYNFNQSGGSFRYQIEPEMEEIEGSPYYLDEWKPGQVYLSNNSYVELENIKYNVRLNEIVFRLKGQQYLFPDKSEIVRIKIGADTFISSITDKNEFSFFQVLEGNEQFYLLKKYKCLIRKGEPSKGYVPATNDKYVLEEDLYIKTLNREAVRINPRTGFEILNYVEDTMQEAIQNYIKSNKLKMKKTEDLAQVVQYLSVLNDL